MNPFPLRPHLRLWRFILMMALIILGHTTLTAGEKKIYIVTDLEGASGVYKFTQTRNCQETDLGRQAMEYLMGDIAAVVRGLREGGATEIIVSDGHGSQAFVPHLMAPGAKYITGLPRSGGGVDESFVGLVQLGCHAMMGTPDGVLNHTQSSKTENRYWYNGVESGELAQSAAIAGHYGVPTIMVTGDEAACREARQFFGDGCVTVAVKRGLSREAAMLYPFVETRQALYKGAKRAMSVIRKCKPYKLTVPIKAKKQYLILTPAPPKLMIKEGEITNVLDLYRF
ncbi:MAG: M55 family metallopeptidase [Verrucomicrobiia bacterium]